MTNWLSCPSIITSLGKLSCEKSTSVIYIFFSLPAYLSSSLKKIAWCQRWITEVPWHWARIMWVWRTKTGWLLYIINPDNQLTVEPGKKRCFSLAEVFLRYTLAGKRSNLWVTAVHKKKKKQAPDVRIQSGVSDRPGVGGLGSGMVSPDAVCYNATWRLHWQ